MLKKSSITKLNRVNNDIQNLRVELAAVIKDYELKSKIIHKHHDSSKIKVLVQNHTGKEDELRYCPQIVLTLESGHKHLIKTISWQNFPLSGAALPIFLSFCEKYTHLNTLSLEDAHLQEADLKILQTFLRNFQNIVDLNLSGNLYRENFNLVLINTNVRYFTLKYCKITRVEDVEKLLKPLRDPYKCPLIHLNLSNNEIGDSGAKEIAKMLRINRVLLSLNVASNNITNEGVKYILETLKNFKLNQDEISRRKKIFCRYYMKKYIEKKTEEAAMDMGSVITLSNSRKVKSAKHKKLKGKQSKSSVSLTDQAKKRSLGNRASEILPAVPEISDIEKLLDYDSAHHPFVEETSLEGVHFICKGNFVLMYLNVSFNLLTAEILSDIHAVLNYQNRNGTLETGLAHVVLEGNDFKRGSLEAYYIEIVNLLTMKTPKTPVTMSHGSRKLERKRSKSAQ